MLTKEKLIVDLALPVEGDSVAAYLFGATGGSITTTTIGGVLALDVAVKEAVGVYATGSVAGTAGLAGAVVGVRQDASGPYAGVADGDYHPFLFNDQGQLKVAADVQVSGEFNEDSPHTSGDGGLFVLSVRQDTLATSTSADGDYSAFKVDSLGRLWTHAMAEGLVADGAADANNPLKIGSRVVAGVPVSAANAVRADLISDKFRRILISEAASVSLATTATSVPSTGDVAIVAAAATGRTKILVQNLGNRAIWVGAAGVTDADGLRIAAGGTLELPLGENVALFAVADSGTQDVRVMELA